jgi:hypothetical protein
MESDAKVQQYILLGKSARGRSLVELICKATAEPGLFGFGEILALASVQAVSTWVFPMFLRSDQLPSMGIGDGRDDGRVHDVAGQAEEEMPENAPCTTMMALSIGTI